MTKRVDVKDWKTHQREDEDRLFFVIKFIALGILMLISIYTIYSARKYNFDTSMKIALGVFFVTFLLILYGKKYLPQKRLEKGKGFFKEYLIWIIPNFIAIEIGFFAILRISYLSNPLLLYLFMGFLLEISNEVMQYFVFKRKIKINKYFLYWVLINSVFFFFSNAFAALLLMNLPPLLSKSYHWAALIIALSQVIFLRFVWALIEKKD